jgi:hypothetical protein
MTVQVRIMPPPYLEMLHLHYLNQVHGRVM